MINIHEFIYFIYLRIYLTFDLFTTINIYKTNEYIN